MAKDHRRSSMFLGVFASILMITACMYVIAITNQSEKLQSKVLLLELKNSLDGGRALSIIWPNMLTVYKV